MNLFFLPAERRISNTGQPFTLMSITPEDNARSIAASRHGQDGAVLEDYEFENYARTLCVAAYLPNAQGELNASAQSDWSRFLEGVNGVLSPKVLLPLTQEEPGNLRVLLPDGNIHGLAGLSSGERQAMIIISRIFRAGEGHTSVAIDEPDAYLHPSLSTRLLRALRLGMPAGAGLILATHSPAILDSIEPSHILRFRHGSLPSPVLTEDDRLELYRSAGFRASAITQSELLVVTEGELDGQVMRDLIPEMSAVSVHAAGGRDLVLRDVAALSGFSLPIIGVVDGDLLANRPSEEIAQLVHVWPTADIEGALLSDAGFLAAALEARLFRPEVTSVEVLQDTLDQILRSFEAETIAEYAMRRLRAGADLHWPSPKDPHAETKVRALGQSYYALEAESIDRAFAAAQTAWSDAETSRWTLVRGKYVLRRLVSEHSIVEGADAFVRAALAGHPTIAAIEPLRRKVTDLLGSISSCPRRAHILPTSVRKTM